MKRPTHTWLKPVLDAIDGIGVVSVGVPTSTHAFYGGSGFARIATGGNGIIPGATYLGASGFGATLVAASGVALSASGLAIFLARAAYGSTGKRYTTDDLVDQLKNMNILPR